MVNTMENRFSTFELQFGAKMRSTLKTGQENATKLSEALNISFIPMTHTYIYMLHLLKTGSLDNAIQDLLLA